MATLHDIVSLFPALMYAALFYFMPGQVHFVLQDGLNRFWPFAFSVAILWAYGICQWVLVRTARQPRWAAKMVAGAPMLVVLAGYLSIPGYRVVVLLAGGVAVAAFAVATLRSPVLTRAQIAMGGLALFGTAAISAALSPIEFPRAIGSFAILAISLGAVTIAATLFIIRPRIGSGLICLVTVVVLLSAPNDHSLPTTSRSGGTKSIGDGLTEWIDNRADIEAYRAAKLPYPVILVSSEGGGIYAAAHSYGALSTLSGRCPTFAQHVFALVGVSGGAIGNALYSANVSGPQSALAPCSSDERKIDLAPIATDHLSPVLARFLLLEILDRILPGRWLRLDRASILTKSFLSAASDQPYLVRSITGSWDAKSARPALISVATSMQNGRRLILAPMKPNWGQSTGDWWPGGPVEQQLDISVMEAASVSARFPWVTPTALLKSGKAVSYVLADDGYFENSGAETVIDIVNEIKTIANLQREGPSDAGLTAGSDCRLYVHANFRTRVDWQGCSRHVFLIHFSVASSCMATLGQGCGDLNQLGQSFLLDPVETLLASRSARGALALERSQIEMCGSGGGECLNPDASMGFFRSQIRPEELGVPLGWHISRAMAEAITSSAIPRKAFNYRTGNCDDPDNDNDVSRLIYHFDLSLYDGKSQPDIECLLGSP